MRELIHHRTESSAKVTLLSDFKISNPRLKSAHPCIEIADPGVRVLCSWTQPKCLYTHFDPVRKNIYILTSNVTSTHRARPGYYVSKRTWEGLPCE